MTFVLVAATALLWPGRMRMPAPTSPPPAGPPAFGRLDGPAAASRRGVGRDALRLVAPATWVSAAGAAAAAFALAGPVGLLATLTLLGTVALLVRRAVRGRRRRLDMTDVRAALLMLARELRAGAEPAVAAGNAAAASRGAGAAVLGGLAQLARSDGREVPLGGAPDEPTAQALDRLRSGWLLTQRHGLAFTPLVDALAADFAAQLAADSERAGQVAGPRMSGYVMAVLPLMGLALGVGMGADPVRVLIATGVGNVLLLFGVALTCAGLLWSARIVNQ